MPKSSVFEPFTIDRAITSIHPTEIDTPNIDTRERLPFFTRRIKVPEVSASHFLRLNVNLYPRKLTVPIIIGKPYEACLIARSRRFIGQDSETADAADAADAAAADADSEAMPLSASSTISA